MKKYLKILPLILYPYAYLIYLCVILFLRGLADILSYEINVFGNEIRIDNIVFIFYNLWVLFLALHGAIGAFKRYTPVEAAKMNLAVKGWQIPAYLFNFLVGALGLAAGIWGVWATIIVIVIDLATIALSGIHAIGSVRRLKKEGLLSSGKAFWAGLGSFIYCVDVIVAIVLVAMCKTKKNGTAVEKAAPPPLPSAPQAPSPAPNETQDETASLNTANVPQQEQQTAAENPLLPPSPVPPAPAPVPDETKSETASTNAVNAPQPKKRRKASEMPPPPPLPPASQKPAPAQNEAGDETAPEE